MIDKVEQRRRAAEMSQQLAAQGLEAPKLTYPVKPKPEPVNVHLSYPFLNPPKPAKKEKPPKLDCAGKQLYVGDTVATVVDGIVSVLRTGKIVRLTKDRVEIEIVSFNTGRMKKILKYPQAVVKVT